MARKKRNRRSAPKRSAPKKSAPKRSAPKRSAPKKSAPKRSAKKLQIQQKRTDRQSKKRRVEDKKSKRVERRSEDKSKKSNKSSKKKDPSFEIPTFTRPDRLPYEQGKDDKVDKEAQETIDAQEQELRGQEKELKQQEKTIDELTDISEASADKTLAYEVPTRKSLKFEEGLAFIQTNAAKIYEDRKSEKMPGRSGDYEVDNLKTVKDKITEMGGAGMYDKNNRFMGGQVGKNETLRINKQGDLKAVNLSEDPYGLQAQAKSAKNFKRRTPELRSQQRNLSRILSGKKKQKQPLGKAKSIQKDAKKFVNRLGKK